MSVVRSRPDRRRGLTLVEVCLVLALLVVIGAMAAPLMEGTFSRAGLQSGAELVRGAWARARLVAMDSGQTHVFRFEPRASRFQIVALDQLGMPASEMLQPEDPNAEHAVADMLRLPQSRLPDGVVFAAGDISDSSQVLATLGTATQSAWSAPILFHPDGTTSDASIVLANAAQQTVRVTLRGLTGIANTSDVGMEAIGP
jgi:type II secretory pathway pseudopilin PulG